MIHIRRGGNTEEGFVEEYVYKQIPKIVIGR